MSEGQSRDPGDKPEASYQEVLSSVLDCVMVIDAGGGLVSANDRAADLAEMTVEELKHLDLSAIVELFRLKVRDADKFRQQVSALRDQGPVAAELVFPLAGSAGNLRIYSMPVVPVKSARPAEAGELLRTEDEELEHLKKEFISTISHELRTPLTAIKGALGLALGGAAGPIAPQMRELLELAEKNTDRLIALINDILDMFRLETRRLPLRAEPVSLEDSIQHEVSRNWEAAQRNNVRLETQIEPNLPAGNGDRVRLEQALDNLLSNAIKFSPPGGIVLVAARKVVENGAAFVEVSVRDHGKGISPEAQKRIFSKFAQAEDTLTREHQGSGLGLALTKAIVDLHGGRIWCESTPGKGSTFFFTVPAATTVPRAPSVSAAEAIPGETPGLPLVLVVDDDRDVARVVCGIFTSSGYRASAVDRGEEAVELAERHQPALIALDLFMPGMSGFEVLHLLKQNPRTRSIPVICMSVVDDSGRAIALGAERFVSKPIDAHALLEIAGSILGRNKLQAPGTPGSPGGSGA